MKKHHLVLVLSMMLVLGFAASAFAIHAKLPGDTTAVFAPRGTEIRLGGEVRVRGWYGDNITNRPGTLKAATGFPYKGGSMAWYDQRVRLLLDVKTAPNVTGRIRLETEPANWNWGMTGTDPGVGGTVASPGTGGVKRSAHGFRVLDAWIAYTGKELLGVTSGIRLGHQPIVVGEGTFFDHGAFGDDAILLFVEPAKGTEINLLAAKLSEHAVAINTDDIDLYSLILSHKVDKDNTIGANYSIIKTDHYVPVVGVPPAPAGVAVYRGVPDRAGDSLDIRNLGLFAKGKIADLGYRVTADFQAGLTETSAGVTREEYSGYAFTAGVNHKIDPVTVRANFVYGSGDPTVDSKNKAFQTFVSTGIDPNLPTVVYNWRVSTAADVVPPGVLPPPPVPPAPVLGTGISNTTAYNLGLTFEPIKDMTAHLDYYLLRASERLSATPDTLGYGRDIGSELDLRLSYRLARGLTYSINSGILFAGDFYRAAAAGVTSVPKNAVVFQHGLVFSF